MTVAATIPDELAARVPGDSADRGDFRRRGPNRVFEEGRSSAVDGRGAMVEGWPTIGPSLGPQRCKYDEPERSHKTQRREKESRETGRCFRFDLRLARFRSVGSVAHGVFASQDSGIGHQLRNSSRLLWTPRKSGPASSLRVCSQSGRARGAPPEGWSVEPSSREIRARQEPRPPRKPSFGTASQSS